jgi:hypothetical protein
MVGTPGLGKTTLSNLIVMRYRASDMAQTIGHYTADAYKNMDAYIHAIMSSKEDILILDRCNEKMCNRMQLIELFRIEEVAPVILCVDFINTNNKVKLKHAAKTRIKDRDPEGQSLIYDSSNDGYVVHKVIEKKLNDYVTPKLAEGFDAIINIKLGTSANDVAADVLKIINVI